MNESWRDPTADDYDPLRCLLNPLPRSTAVSGMEPGTMQELPQPRFLRVHKFISAHEMEVDYIKNPDYIPPEVSKQSFTEKDTEK